MNDTVEDDVRTAFGRLADPVLPRPDPLGRLLVRRRRRRWRRGLGAAATAVVLAFAGGTLARASLGGPTGPSPTPGPAVTAGLPGLTDLPKARLDAWTRRLVESPTRGNLAGDGAYVEALERAIPDRHRFADPAQDRVKVLALADVTGARIAVVARYDDEFGTVVVYGAPSDATPAELAESGTMSAPLRPFVTFSGRAVTRAGTEVDDLAMIALAPAGCGLESSVTTTINVDGTTTRFWQYHGDHLLAPGDIGRTWWKVTCDGRVRFEAPTSFLRGWGVASAPAPERGGADPELVTAAVGAWHDATGHLGPAEPRVLWAGDTGSGRTTVVVAGPGRNGRTLVTAMSGAAGGGTGAAAACVYYGQVPYTREPVPGLPPGDTDTRPLGTATAASTDLVIVRLPGSGAPEALGDRLLVVAPPTATKVTAAEIELTLLDGVGVTNAGGGGIRLTFTAVDAAGAIVATATYGEPAGTGQFFGERVVDDWR